MRSSSDRLRQEFRRHTEVHLRVGAWVLLTVAVCRPHAIGWNAAGALALAVLVGVACGMATPAVRPRLWLGVATGGGAGALFVLSVSTWIVTVVAATLGTFTVASLPNWRGVPRDGALLLRSGALFLTLALAPAAAVAAAAAATGSLPAFLTAFQIAVPTDPWSWLAWTGLVALIVTLGLDGESTNRADARFVRGLLLALTGAALVARLIWILSVATSPIEAFWFEGPFLVNALKLRAHEPLYGPMQNLNSYTYSPLIDVVHHAILAPFGLDLSLCANRTLILLDQLVAAAVLVWAATPYARRARLWLAVALGHAAFASLVAPAIHPDHPMLACTAVAFALLIAEERWPRWLWWTALILVTPVATGLKLSGAGIGLGLFVAFLRERRWPVLAALLASAVFALATVPLFEEMFGDYVAYAIGVQAGGAFDWPRLTQLPLSPFGLSALLAVGYALWVRGQDPSSATQSIALRVVTLTAAVTLIGLPAYLKASGRDNNLTPLLIGSVVLVIVAGGQHAARRGAKSHPLLPAALTLASVLAVRPPARPLEGAERADAAQDFAELTRTIREDASAGRRTLSLLHVAPWIAAGRRDVPLDRYASAMELFYADRAEADVLFRHVGDGRYDTILGAGSLLRPAADARGQFNMRLLMVLNADYEVAYPRGGLAAPSVPGAVIFRRRQAPR